MSFIRHSISQLLDMESIEREAHDIEREQRDEELSTLIDESIATLSSGTIVQGRILDKRNNFFLVDVGLKSEGLVPVEEFMVEPQRDEANLFSPEEFLIECIEDRRGNMILSKRKVSRIRGWEEIVNTKHEGDMVEGEVIRKIKGGLLLDIGIPVFLPASQIDIRRAPDIAEYIGQTLQCKILKIDTERKNIVVSRRKLIEETRTSQKEVLLGNLQEGQTVEGVVKNITDFGAFIDLGGIDGLLHITDMAWKKINHPSELLKINDRVRVRVLNFDRRNERISLTMKQLSDSPWADIEARYPVDGKLKGKIVNIMPYGAFVEIEEGIEGLVHVSEMSWTKKIHHPSEIAAIGDVVDVVVLSINKDKEEISLGMKQVHADPWGEMNQRYPEGTEVTGTVRNLTAYGTFIELEEGIDGLLHVSDMSWTRRIQTPSQLLKKGDVVTTKVLRVDEEKKRISLGLKQMQSDPWVDEVPRRIKVGTVVKGTVEKITSFGVFIKIDSDLEGLLHTTEISVPGNLDTLAPENLLKQGQEIAVMVVHVDSEKRRIGLSQKAVTAGLPGSERLNELSKLEDEAEQKMVAPIQEE